MIIEQIQIYRHGDDGRSLYSLPAVFTFVYSGITKSFMGGGAEPPTNVGHQSSSLTEFTKTQANNILLHLTGTSQQKQ